jgi:hypothetical protein
MMYFAIRILLGHGKKHATVCEILKRQNFLQFFTCGSWQEALLCLQFLISNMFAFTMTKYVFFDKTYNGFGFTPSGQS